MIYSAEVVHLSDDIEEEVILRINGIDITCFASVCPFRISEGATYQVALTPVVFGDYCVCEASEGSDPSLVSVNKGFSYDVIGKLTGGRLDARGIVLEDDILLRDYGYLDQKVVVWRVDRIDVEFLSH